MDQAARLRELVDKKKPSNKLNLNMISILSGKGGVGKTTLVSELYKGVENSLIVDCDINSPYFWLYKNKYRYVEGFTYSNKKVVVEKIEKNIRLDRFNYVFVDAGTGINEINKYYIDKSRINILVTDMNEISILNTCNLMKDIRTQKVVYLKDSTPSQFKEMQGRINVFSKKFINGDIIKVVNTVEDLIKYLKVKRVSLDDI